MGGVAKNVAVRGVQGGAALPHDLHIAKPGSERSQHVGMTPLLDGGPLSSAYSKH